MMRREAEWLGRHLDSLTDAELGSVLSVGSGTGDFRQRYQPWIDGQVFDRLAHRGVTVLHHEMDAGEGVDIVGDLRDEEVRASLAHHSVRTILCLNVLEHVPAPADLVAAIEAAVPVGGRAVVTVPRRFPFHADPIDTMFRPSPTDLAGMFSAAMTVASGALKCESLASYWLAKPGKLTALRKVARGGKREHHEGPAHGPQVGGALEFARMAIVSTEVTFAVATRAV